MLKNKSIGKKVTVYMAITIIVALMVTVSISAIQAYNALKNDAMESLDKSATDNANVLSEKIKGFEEGVEGLAKSPNLQSMSPDEQKQQCKSLSDEYGFLRAGIASSDGTLSYPNGTNANVADRDYFKTAMKGNLAVSDPLMAKTDNRLVLFIAAPIENNSGKTVGAVVAALDGDFLCNQVKKIKLGTTGNVTAFNAEGTTIADKNIKRVTSQENIIKQSESNKTLLPMANMTKKMISGVKGQDSYTYNGVSKYCAYAPIPGTPWFLLAGQSETEIMMPIYQSVGICFLVAIIFLIIAIIVCHRLIMELVTKRLKKAEEMMEELAKNHLGARFIDKRNDEIGKLGNAMNQMADGIQNKLLVAVKNIADGRMDKNVEAVDSEDEVAPVVNTTIHTVKAIINESNDMIEAAKNGKLDLRCNASGYKGEWANLAGGLNDIMDSVSGPIEEARNVIRKISVNDYTTKMEGNYKGTFKNLHDDVNAVMDRLVNVQECMKRAARGDTDGIEELQKIGKRSENDELMPALIAMMQSIRNIIDEVRHLAEESINGNFIATRGDVQKFEGGFRDIVEGFNDTLDAIARPVSETMEALKKLSVNDVEFKMHDDYKGDYKLIAEATEKVRMAFTQLTDILVMSAKGDLSKLPEFREMGKLCDNDRLSPAIVQMMESVQTIADSITRVAGSAAEGDLSIRGDVHKCEGKFADIVSSINTLLDAVENPIDKVKSAMQNMASCKLDTHIDGEFKGGFKELIDNVNDMAATLSRLVKEICAVMTQVADDNLQIDEIAAYSGDFEPISTSLNRIISSLNEILGNISQTAEQVSAGSSQVAAGSQSLSQGTTEQASAVEELTASMGEIAQQTKQNAEDSAKTNKLVVKVQQNAADGNTHMDEMLKSMDEIGEASANISKIIKVIDGIAFQTNILALNAAVEAARAGSSGKGFAVVAEEVKNLAGRSAQAAKQTTTLIDATAEKVKNGRGTASNTAIAFKSIVSGVGEVSTLVNRIAAASNEQASGIAQVDKGLSQVSQVVQTNSATSEESAAASEELSGQAGVLKEQIAKFSLREQK